MPLNIYSGHWTYISGHSTERFHEVQGLMVEGFDIGKVWDLCASFPFASSMAMISRGKKKKKSLVFLEGLGSIMKFLK